MTIAQILSIVLLLIILIIERDWIFKELFSFLFKKKDQISPELEKEIERAWNSLGARIWVEKPYTAEEIAKGIMSINEAAAKGYFIVPPELRK